MKACDRQYYDYTLRRTTNLSVIGTRSYQGVIKRVPTVIVSFVRNGLFDSYQSVSNTTAVCPLNSGSSSGNRPFSLIGMTAKAPPPLASQLTEM